MTYPPTLLETDSEVYIEDRGKKGQVGLWSTQEESSTWSGGEGQEGVCLFPISTMGGTEINEI